MLHTIISYIRIAFPFIYLFGVWRFGDWKHWRKYYPSILFIISVDFFIGIVMYESPLWTFHGALITPNHTITDFLITFTCFTQMVLIYLSRYPYKAKWFTQLGYIVLWSMGFFVIEFMFKSAGLISYNHGWHIGWSSLVWLSMFVTLRIHHTKPLWAWLLCFSGVAFMILYFDIPITKLR